MSVSTLSPGGAAPLGAYVTADGVSLSVDAPDAERVQACLFTEDGAQETDRVELSSDGSGRWTAFLKGAAAGLVYGYRAHGPYAPDRGLWFNPRKLLLDPYAKALAGDFTPGPEHFCGSDAPDPRDNAASMLKARALDPRSIRRPRACAGTDWGASLIYETHVRGFTQNAPWLSAAERGRFDGLSHAEGLKYLKALGVTALELLPIQAFIDEPHLDATGLTNYWGYNPINVFTPHPRYCGPEGPAAFARFVDRAHDAGLEVILDVVYNHTAEGGVGGRTLSWRGLDNCRFYRLHSKNPAWYDDLTDCGATVDFREPSVRAWCLDSLVHWVEAYGVDGFRFDIAPVHGLTDHGFDPDAPFFAELAGHPALQSVKLIAEPWHCGPGGLHAGRFPQPWREWSGKARDDIRRYWRGDAGAGAALADTLDGGAAVFGEPAPARAVNYVACHDGFTLADVVRYAHKHNHANGEDNRDGHNDNVSDNFGVEGETDDRAVTAARLDRQANMLASALLAVGAPMLLGGDEFGRTQGGNNNAYAQDNATSWLDWRQVDTSVGARLTALVADLMALRRRHPGLLGGTSGARGQDWRAPSGAVASEGPMAGVLVNADAPSAAQLWRVLNPTDAPASFQTPPTPNGTGWRLAAATGLGTPEALETGAILSAPPYSLSVFEWSPGERVL